ncbi:MAG TPA: hypothetical protein VFT34_12810 [Verrucomicrobiae bacterium]|nr:hypothetical protein [Verrucomicrobiae bacterium]
MKDHLRIVTDLGLLEALKIGHTPFSICCIAEENHIQNTTHESL